ncbi:helicase HerA-like domain-containing protein [Salinibacterium sp. TMP30]|uniref:helicase HerA-like domain-containing protein n=1 Tax=Salinibacterium sp. TMP30 TaxID=3138237 RepID=UPI003139EB3A
MDATTATSNPAAPNPAVPNPAAKSATVDGPLNDAEVAAVRAGYAVEGDVLEMGALVNGGVLADVPVRIPVAMLNRHGLVAGATGTGVPIRATVSSFGPLLLSKVLGLNDTQESSLGLIFHYADQERLPLADLFNDLPEPR